MNENSKFNLIIFLFSFPLNDPFKKMKKAMKQYFLNLYLKILKKNFLFFLMDGGKENIIFILDKKN